MAISKHRVESLNTGVYDQLKEMIARRELEPGARLVQQELAKNFGTSPIPVVEALRRLERDGLVTHVPHLGSFVRESTVDDLRELYCIRRGLECEACRLFIHAGTPAEKDRMVALNDQLNMAAREQDAHHFIDLDLKFHMHIVAGARVTRLREIVESRHIEERIFQNAPELKNEGPNEHLLGCHDEIVATILSGDEEAAALAMRRHLLEAEQLHLKAVELASK